MQKRPRSLHADRDENANLFLLTLDLDVAKDTVLGFSIGFVSGTAMRIQIRQFASETEDL